MGTLFTLAIFIITITYAARQYRVMVDYADTVNLISETEDLRDRDNAYNLSDIEMQLAFGITVVDKITFDVIDIDLNGIFELEFT